MHEVYATEYPSIIQLPLSCTYQERKKANMAPAVTETVAQVTENLKQKVVTSLKDQVQPNLETGHREPLKLSGALDQFKQFEVTPVIGKEFVDVDLAEWLKAPNSDELLRDLAITGTALWSSLYSFFSRIVV